MLYILSDAFIHALTITAFVFMMMVIVEYLNILLKGRLGDVVGRRPLRQSLFGGFLGASPGCLGAYTNVTLYEHGLLAFGALMAGMVATTGDESFLMLTLFPIKFLILTGALLVIGVVTGVLLDKFASSRLASRREEHCDELVVHETPDIHPDASPMQRLVANFTAGHRARWAILVLLLTLAVLIATGFIAEHEGVWIKGIMVFATIACVWITLFGSDHFIGEHVWRHVVMRHLPRIFLWTFGVLLGLAIVGDYIDVPLFVQDNPHFMLLLAGLVGLIPISGPHFIFVTLFADGALPFAILFANMLVQDGHGMLPLLAFSRRDFIVIKAIKLIIGLGLGAALLAIGI
jgi:MFS family permease